MTKPVQDSLTRKDGRLNEQSTTIPSGKGNGPASRPGSAKFPSSVEMGPKKFGEGGEQQILKNLKNPARHYPEEGQEPERVHSQRQLGLEVPAMTMAGSESARLWPNCVTCMETGWCSVTPWPGTRPGISSSTASDWARGCEA